MKKKTDTSGEQLIVHPAKEITEQAVKDAMGMVTAIDASAEQAGIIMQYLETFADHELDLETSFTDERQRDAMIAFFITVMPRAITNTKGRFHHILKRRGLLSQKIVSAFHIDPAAAAEWLGSEEVTP